MVEKYRHFGTWKELAHKYGADPQRVDVWDAFSELFLDAVNGGKKTRKSGGELTQDIDRTSFEGN